LKNKILGCLTAALVTLVVARVSARNPTPHLPRAGSDTFPTAAALTITNGAGFPCTVFLTGSATYKRGTPIGGSNVVINTEITSMQLQGASTDLGGEVFLRAGSNLVGRATLGDIVGNSPGFTATSFYDLFFELQLPGGTNYFNTNAVIVVTTVTEVPQINVFYTNLNSVALLEVVGGVTNVNGNLTQLWLVPSQSGKDTKLGISRNVSGTLTQGDMKMGLCFDTNSIAAMSVQIKNQNLTGPMTINAACDELGITASNTFRAVWTSDLRAPDWRGTHKGTFTIVQGTGGNSFTFATGTMSGNNGTGTHRTPGLTNDCESCAECNHFEGVLSGKITASGPYSGARLQATYTGQFVDTNGVPLSCCPPPAMPPGGHFNMTIDGVVITKGCVSQ